MVDVELAQSGDFLAGLSYNPSGIPKSIDIKKENTATPVASFDLDAVDAMGFCDASQFMVLPANERAAAISCLSQALHQKYGGKNMLAVPAGLVREFEDNGFSAVPQTPSGGAYGRLLVSDTDSTLQKVTDLAQQSPALPPTITAVTDKDALLGMKAELSDLLLKNAPYATGEKSDSWPLGDKQPFYTPEAMQGRLEPEKIHACALVDKQTQKPIAFVRSYIEPGVGTYVSDLVVDSNYRGDQIGLKLMQAAANALPEDARTAKLFVIAGDDREQAFFEQSLGFHSIAASGRVVALENDKVFMFGLIPKQEILLNLPEGIAAISSSLKGSRAGHGSAHSGDEPGTRYYHDPSRLRAEGVDRTAHGWSSTVRQPKGGTDIIR